MEVQQDTTVVKLAQEPDRPVHLLVGTFLVYGSTKNAVPPLNNGFLVSLPQAASLRMRLIFLFWGPHVERKITFQ
jgi:hypothetical protein